MKKEIHYVFLRLSTFFTSFYVFLRLSLRTNFLEILNMTFEKVDVDKKEIYILGDFNMNMFHNNRYIVHDDNTISSKSCLMILKTITNFARCMA